MIKQKTFIVFSLNASKDSKEQMQTIAINIVSKKFSIDKTF